MGTTQAAAAGAAREPGVVRPASPKNLRLAGRLAGVDTQILPGNAQDVANATWKSYAARANPDSRRR